MNELDSWKRTLDVFDIDGSFSDPAQVAAAMLDIEAIGYRKVPSREQLEARREEERRRRVAYIAEWEVGRPSRSAIRSREIRRKQKRKHR